MKYEMQLKMINIYKYYPAYIINCWLLMKAEVKHDIKQYWTFCDNLAVVDGKVLRVEKK